jgi:glutamate-ammonia-ligase adenylyltransferase
VLTRERDIAKLAAEIKSMRERIAAELGSKNPAMFDLKHDPGGMTDVEFAVQFAVLAHSRRAPQLIDNAGTLALLERAAAGGLLPPGAQAAAGGALESYAYYRSVAHRLRLDERPLKIPADDIISARRERVLELWNLTMATTARPSESDGATSARASTKPRS